MDETAPLGDALLRVAQVLAASSDIREITGAVTSAALELTQARGAYVERVVSPRLVEVVGNAGEGTPPQGTEVPYPGSLTDELAESGEPLLMDTLDGIGAGMAPYLTDSCSGCSGMVLPLIAEGELMGALVLLRDRADGGFGEETATPAGLLAALTAVALRRLREEQEYTARHERFVALAENAAEAIVSIDANDRILFANRAAQRIFGYSEEELASTGFTKLIPERFRTAHQAGMRRYIETSERHVRWDGIELVGLHRDGREIPLEVTFGEFRQGDNHFFTGLMRDITERKRVQEERDSLFAQAEEGRQELERVLKGKSRLIRGFSHDIKNPLGAADGYAQLMLDGLMGDLTQKQTDALDRIRRSISAALGLINDVVEFSRAESGQIEVRPHPFNADALVREVVEDHRAAADQAEVDLKAEEVNGGELVCDAIRIRQILGNLVTNAIKYGGSGSSIRLRARREVGDTPRVLFTVEDTGPGIPGDKQHLLFEEFQRLHTGQKEGSGLGLAISRRIARVLGGDILVDSEEGRGSRFTLWIPAPPPD